MKGLTIARIFSIYKPIALLFLIMCTYMMTHAQTTYYTKQIHSGGTTEFSKPADINQDGEIDILLANGKLFWFENDGNENFTSHQIPTTFSSITNASMADINQDGDMDIVVTSVVPSSKLAWFENDGNENFTAHVIDNLRSICLYVADIDENGTMDVISANELGTGAYWYKNDGNGNFTKKTINSDFKDGYSAYVADLDNDGDNDIAMSNAGRDKVVWFENDGSENFTLMSLNSSSLDYTNHVHVDDLNGDGLLDIVATSLLNRRIVWYQNDGGGSFTRKTISSDYWSPHSVYSLDWEGDGDRDLITTSATAEVMITIWENDGAGNFTQNDIITDFPGRDVHAIDMDGDGDPDIIGGKNNGVDLFIACTDYSNGPAATVLCANPTVELDEDGQYTFTGTELVQGSTDPCTVFSFVSASPAMVDCEDARQTITVTVTAQDDDGNSSTCTANVSVEDNILPEITCQDITVTLADVSVENIPGEDILVSGTDNCLVNSYSLLVTPSKVSCVDIGEVPVTLKAFPYPSNGGQEVFCNVTVTVVDGEAPSVLCSDITVELDENDGTVTIAPEDIDGVYAPAFDRFILSNDNCGFASLTLDQTEFDCSHIGENTVKLTGVDLSGNSKSCNATVTVIDAVVPTAVICNNPTVSLDANGQYTFTGSDVFQSATDACVVSFVSASPASVSCTDVGNSVQVTVTVQDEGGNTATCMSSVMVEDNTAPSVQCATSIVTLDANGEYTFTDAELIQSSTDACSAVSFVSASPASVSCSDVGNSVQVTVTVQDEGGNTATCMSSVTVEDNTAPSVQCATPTVILDANGEYVFTGSEVFQGGTDVCSAVSFVSASPVSVDCDDLFSPVQVTVTAQDAVGNTANCTSIVIVKENIPLQVSCRDTTLNADFNGVVNTADFAVRLTEVESGSCVSSFIEDMSPMIVDCSTVGDIPTTMTIVSLSDGIPLDTVTCTSIITIVDRTPPRIRCHDITVALDANGEVVISPEDIDGEIIDGDIVPTYDVCSGYELDLSIDFSSFDCNDLGANPVTLTATDLSGISSDCTVYVTVEEGTSLPAGWQSADIGQSGAGNDYTYNPCSQIPEYTVIGGGNNATTIISDNIAFSSYSICGDGSITAKIESVDPNGYGGLMIRESLDAGAKQASIFSNMTNNLRFESRSTTNGMKQINSFFKPSPIWLKLERQGDWIFAYYSSTGYNFQYIHAVFVPMQSCVEFGLASFTYLPGSQTEAVFSNVTITSSNGGNGGDNNNTIINEVSKLSNDTTPSENLIPWTLNPEPWTMDLYPNPNTGQFTLKMDEPTQNRGFLTIYTPYGQQLYQQPVEAGFTQKQINLGSVPAGMYLLEYQDENAQRIVKKFTISK